MKTMTDLYEAQKALDELIVAKRGLEGKALLDDKVLALNESLGKMAGKWSGHKYWLKHQNPNTEGSVSCKEADAEYYWCGTCHENFDTTVPKDDNGHRVCPTCNHNILMGFRKRNQLLEAYAECLSRILSIANTLGAHDDDLYTFDDEMDGTEVNQVTEMFYLASKIGMPVEDKVIALCFRSLVYLFTNFGENSLGFDFDKVAASMLKLLDEERQRLEGSVTA